METKREAALSGLFDLLQSVDESLTVRRGDESVIEIPAGGLLDMADGTLGDADVTLSPVRYYWVHQVPLSVLVEGDHRQARMDALLQAIGAGLLANPTLDDVILHMRLGEIEISDYAEKNAAPVKQASFQVIMEYETDNPLG